jgi:hypothetical protein
MSRCCKNDYETPFGDLKGRELEEANDLYLYFFDMINDGAKADYGDARNLYANPKNYLLLMKEKEREIDRQGNRNVLHEEGDTVSVASEQMSEMAKRRLLDQEALEHERVEMKKLDEKGLVLENAIKDDESVSYYGPVFDSEPEEIVADIPEKIEHRYYYVHETHT